jgi:hypothetical protein
MFAHSVPEEGKTMQFSVVINAPREKVWRTMLDREAYKVWAEAFMAGSDFVGDWKEGSKILFVAPDPSGKMSGMVSKIQKSTPHEYVSIVHLGLVKDGVEDVTSPDAKAWAGATERYTFNSQPSGTELRVDLEGNFGDLEKYFLDVWPKALQKVKQLAEA